jgi:diacylglycerol kinase family enzyme
LSDGVAARVGGRRRLAASLALVALAAEVVVVVVGLRGQLARLVAAVVLLLAATVSGWFGVTRRGLLRRLGVVVAAVAAGLFALVVLTGDAHGLTLLVVVALGVCSVGLTRLALRRDRRSIRKLPVPGTPVGPARHGVLIMNPRSGGGKATRLELADAARRRGIEAVVLEPGSDLLQLAEDAADRGADVIGMAGGDGSQGVVASVAMRHGVAFVCIPAGTRNHFALDLGLDRDDLVGALDAFGDAVERRIDLADVGGRVFVNNVSLGIYAKIVQSPEYRDAKRETIERFLPELLGPGAQPDRMQFTDPAGNVHDGAQLIQVSNNPYLLTRIAGFGTRARLDTGTLGVSAVELRGAADVTRLLAAEVAGRVRRLRGYTEFASAAVTVESDRRVEAAIDGEAVVLDPPLRFRSLPGVLRVRIPSYAPGYSPAALVPPSKWWTLLALFRTVAGLATPIDESQR